MKLINLTYVCLLASIFYCCNSNNNKSSNNTNTQDTVCVDSVNIDTGRKNNFDNEFTKVHTMKKKDSTIIGDVYVKFEKDSLFRYLYVINEGDTLYSIKNTVFSCVMSPLENFEDYEIIVDWYWDLNKIGVPDFGGYRLAWMGIDVIGMELCHVSGISYGDFPFRDGLYIVINWDYDYNMLVFPLN